MATARLGAAHGVRGELALISLSGETAHLLNIGDVQLRSPQGVVRAARVSGVRQNGGKAIIRLDGVDSSHRHVVGSDLERPRLRHGSFGTKVMIGLLH